MQLLTAGRQNVSALAFAPAGDALAAACSYSSPLLWALPATGDPRALQNPPAYSSSSFTFSPDAAVVGWIAGQERYEFDRGTGATRKVRLAPPDEGLNSQAVCRPAARLILRTVERNVGFRIRGLAPDGTEWREAWTVGPDNELSGWELAPSGADRFFVWERGWNSLTGRRLAAPSALTGEVQAVTAVPSLSLSGLAAAPDGSAVVGFDASSLYSWRVGEKVQKVRTGTLKHYRALAFHPDGRHLLAGNNDTTARLIDTQTWQVVRQYTWDVGRLSAVAVSPDGALAAAGGAKGKVVVWDLDL
ncbi:MAG: hypothetical protein J0I06_17525 [Planctomycetes bacterium]|nr:hypothetical protein [Planctomycetota bacterium]